MNESYGGFAPVYDLLMGDDADYDGRTDYILRLFERFDRKPTLLLDVCCGTGNFSVRMAKKGIDVIGVDRSEEMLMQAREKAFSENTDILYLCQSAEELDLYGTVDGAICCFDSINHITDKSVLADVFKKISLFLEPERLFIFDVNTLYKHRSVLANNTFVIEDGGVFCAWQNSLESDGVTVNIDLDFFVSDGEKYDRFCESFSERAYTPAELCELLGAAGFEVLAVLGDMSEKLPEIKEERIFYVCRKIK